MNCALCIESVADPRVEAYTALTEGRLRLDGLFIAESPKVIHAALDAGYRPVSLLCEERHIAGDAAAVIARCPAGMPVYTGRRDVLAAITGYRLTRGVLCAMRRPEPPSVEAVCAGARRVAVLDQVTDTTNVGAIFRCAAALDVDAVLLTTGTCDPLNRRAVRVSMGTVFRVPWTWVEPSLTPLKALGFKTLAMALRHESVDIDDPRLRDVPRLAVVLGTEGDGLSERAIASADMVARIPMARGVDSLNVAAASAIAFWCLSAAGRGE